VQKQGAVSENALSPRSTDITIIFEGKKPKVKKQGPRLENLSVTILPKTI